MDGSFNCGIRLEGFLPESFLSGSVPELQLYFHPGLDVQRAGVKIYPDRRIGHIAVNSVREALQQRRLPHCRIPKQNYSELILPQAIPCV